MLGRVCTTCNEWKSSDNFHKHAGCKDGINTVCKSCRVVKSRQQWIEKPHLLKMYNAAKSRAVQRKREFTIELDDIIVPEFCPVFNTKLEFGSSHLYKRPSLDRIDSSKGYIKGNVRVICTRANTLKNNGSIWEFERILDDLKITIR